MNLHREDKTFSRTVGIAGLVLVALLSVWVWQAIGDVRADQAAERRMEQAEERRAAEYRQRAQAILDDQQAKTALLQQQVRDLGEKPIVTSDSPQPATIVRAPSPAVLMRYARDAVADALAANPPEDGEDGERGADGVRGADGRQGPPGEDGEDGRGVSDVDCNDDGQFVFTYTDGTTETTGQCRPNGPLEPKED